MGMDAEHGELVIGLTDDGEVAIKLPDQPPVSLEPHEARALARALVAVALDADRMIAGRN